MQIHNDYFIEYLFSFSMLIVLNINVIVLILVINIKLSYETYVNNYFKINFKYGYRKNY